MPPQAVLETQGMMGDLEDIINSPEISDLDHLTRIALVHHQFESIHPFPGGNVRLVEILVRTNED